MKISSSKSAPTPQIFRQLSRFSTTLGRRILLASILLASDAASAREISNGLLTFSENTTDGGVTVTGFDTNVRGNVHDLLIPEVLTVGGISKPVTAIGYRAFWGFYAKVITGTVTIPNSVTTIGESAFYSNEISGVILPDSIDYIGLGAFRSCARLQSVKIPAKLTEISDNAFSGCSSLASVSLTEGLTSIGENAFNSCTSLGSLVLPKSLTRIYSAAFGNCVSLRSVNLPGGVTQIGSGTFEACASLAAVEIAESVSVIGDGAFYDCIRLESVTFYGVPPLVKYYSGLPSVFSHSPSNPKITILCYPGKGFEKVFDDMDQFTIKYIAPDIAVFNSSGTDLRNNSLRNFGRIQTRKASPSVTFRIQNTGSLPLNDIKIGTSGANRLDFKIVSPPARTLAAGAITTFKVKFSPGAKGERGTILKIESNDPDEQIFKIKLTGRGF